MSQEPVEKHKSDDIPETAFNLSTTTIDYIVVGAGPGGGPLACRLAEAGMHVLVLEAGTDPGSPAAIGERNPNRLRQLENGKLMYYCPGLHASSTEPHLYTQVRDEQTSWGFKVRHYATGGDVYYPRASALGGCSSHHAMITIYGSDTDWQKLADLTGDASWSPDKMRQIYRRIERLRYVRPATWLGRAWRWLINKFNPESYADGQRGDHGWLDVTTTDPKLATRDPQLLGVIFDAYFEHTGLSKIIQRIKRWVLNGDFYRDLDLNDAERMEGHPEGVALVPIATTPRGVRRGPRELLLETRQKLVEMRARLDKPGKPDKLTGSLTIVTGIFVRQVILDRSEPNQAPRATGVIFSRGSHLYKASKLNNETKPVVPPPSGKDNEGTCYCQREVILCGGAFNTPQLLMLSGIGDRGHLVNYLPQAMHNDIVDLPGVGLNLRDRYEVSVISHMKRDFASLKGASFQPMVPYCPQLEEWLNPDTNGIRRGIFTSNGAALAILKRSKPESEEPPDLFILGFPAVFRGYYEGWSRDLFRADPDAENDEYNLWSWVILKAFSDNCGTVRLASADPLDPPQINFKYFDDHNPPPANDPDLAALKVGVEFVRGLNDNSTEWFGKEIQPNNPANLGGWIGNEAWGHHPCGTCRIGGDTWKAKPDQLLDRKAVLDSRFRVHGVRGLRVVDASVFPHIPGYFLVTSIYMISEKAAATILDELSC